MRPQQLRDLLAWIDRFANQSEAFKQKLIASIIATYSGVDFYSATEVAAAAQSAAASSNSNAIIAAGLAGQYAAVTTSLMAQDALPAPALLLPALRNGVPMEQVYARPAKLFRRLRSQGVEPSEAFRQAMNLASVITDMNMTMAQREAYQQTFSKLEERAGITGYRRMVHPELAKTGSCGLCIVASDVIYKTNQLLPIHGNCNCTVLPVIGALDPGNSLNGQALGDFYAAAGDSTNGAELKKTRFKVNQHGEYGPVLTVKGQRFTGPEDLHLAA